MAVHLATIFWDPPREAFTVPYLDFSVYWYSLFFAFGFLVAYFIISKLLVSNLLLQKNSSEDKKTEDRQQIKQQTHQVVDALTWYIFIGMLVGARLGHVLFYDLHYYFNHPIEIVMLRNGGLASHGATAGILIALFLFWKKYKTALSPLSMKKLLDILSVGIAFAAGCIRIGNFFNQEILGTPSSLPWAVHFGHPADIHVILPCHPVQLYEASFYFIIFAILCTMEKGRAANTRQNGCQDGFIIGIFLTSVFTFRFFIEWLKLPQEDITEHHLLQMGQLLSIPFILLGIYFLISATRKVEKS